MKKIIKYVLMIIKYALVIIAYAVLICLTLVGFCFFLFGMIQGPTAMMFGGLTVMVTFLFPLLVIAIKHDKRIKAKKERVARKQGFSNFKEKIFRTTKYKFTHVLGLPFMKGVICTLISGRDKITIEAQGTILTLNKSKITYIGREKNIQKYAQAVSSVGGAIAGGILFGGIGAAIGGATYSGDFQVARSYLVITYVNEDENVKYIIFDYKDQAQNLIKDFGLFNKTNIQKQTVEIK